MKPSSRGLCVRSLTILVGLIGILAGGVAAEDDQLRTLETGIDASPWEAVGRLDVGGARARWADAPSASEVEGLPFRTRLMSFGRCARTKTAASSLHPALWIVDNGISGALLGSMREPDGA